MNKRFLADQQSLDRTGSLEPVPSGRATQLRRQLAGLSYDEQLDLVNPPGLQRSARSKRTESAPDRSGEPEPVQMVADDSRATSTTALATVQLQVQRDASSAESGEAEGAADGGTSLTELVGHFEEFDRFLAATRWAVHQDETAYDSELLAAFVSERLLEMVDAGFDILSLDVLTRLQESVWVFLGEDVAREFTDRMNAYFAVQGVSEVPAGPSPPVAACYEAIGEHPISVLVGLDARIDCLAADFDPELPGRTLQGLHRVYNDTNNAYWEPTMNIDRPRSGIISGEQALELVLERVRIRFPNEMYEALSSEIGGHLSMLDDPSSWALGNDAVPFLAGAIFSPLACLLESGSEFFIGLCEGLIDGGAHEAAADIAATLMAETLLLPIFAPVSAVGAVVGVGETIGEAAAQLYLIIADLPAFGAQIMALARTMMGPEGADVARALGYDTGVQYADSAADLADGNPFEVAYGAGKLAGKVLVGVVLGLLAIRAVSGAIRLTGRSVRWIRAHFEPPEMRRLPDGDRGGSGGPAHGDGSDSRSQRERRVDESQSSSRDDPASTDRLRQELGLTDGQSRVLDAFSADSRRAIQNLTPDQASQLLDIASTTTASRETVERLLGQNWRLVGEAIDGGAGDIVGLRLFADLNYIVGRTLPPSTADDIMRRLTSGDASALNEIGVNPPPGFSPTRCEWGLGRTPGGDLVVARGQGGGVNWIGELSNLRPLAHTHPPRFDADIGVGGSPFVDVIQDTRSRTAIFPSAQDVNLMHVNGYDSHQVFTAFRYLGNGRIGLPDADPTAPIIEFVIRSVRESDLGEPFLLSDMTAVANGDVIWEGTVQTMAGGANSFSRIIN